ncbi:alpha/beta hydrolase [Humibacter sp. BT305]|nr:alpha/beta hydrolase [Humibacter sp. BT305]
MGFVTTEDGAEIFYKDWGPKDAQPIMFHHGWPLSSDDWDAQMLFFLQHGYRVVASDRRGHGRSSQIDTGHDMDHYASDADAVVQHLDLTNAIHVGHSTGGGQVARYVAKYGEPQGRVAKAVLVASVPPLMVQTDANPEGTPISVFDGFRSALAANRAQFFLVTQGDDDQIVPYKDASLKQHELLQNSTLKIYEGYPHGMLTTHADVLNPDLLAFIQA